MKINKTQSGFTPTHLLLLLVIVGIIGFAGWKVYDASKSVKPVDTSTTESVAKKEKSEIPDGFVEYENKANNIRFVYPSAWGNVNEQTIEPADAKYEAEYGNRNPLIELSFSLLDVSDRFRVWTKENARITTSAQASSNCAFNAQSDKWEPTQGSIASSGSCNYGRRAVGSTTVYEFTKTAPGSFAYREVFAIQDKFFEISSNAASTDWGGEFGLELKEGASERIQSYVQDKVNVLIKGNNK